jgi:hypothetical protein
MTREEKLELIERMLGLQHKLKVHDSVKNMNSHEEIAANNLARWEIEDEISAIEKLLEGVRQTNVQLKLKQIQEDYLSGHSKKKK